MTPEERNLRAIKVRSLLDDPDVQTAFREIEADLFAEWKKTFDSAERDNLWRAMNIIDRLQQWMISAASGDLSAIKRR